MYPYTVKYHQSRAPSEFVISCIFQNTIHLPKHQTWAACIGVESNNNNSETQHVMPKEFWIYLHKCEPKVTIPIWVKDVQFSTTEGHIYFHLLLILNQLFSTDIKWGKTIWQKADSQLLIMMRESNTKKWQKYKEMCMHSPLWILVRGLQLGVFSLLEDVDPYCIRSKFDRVFTHLWTLELFFHHAFTFPFGSCKKQERDICNVYITIVTCWLWLRSWLDWK